MPQPSALLNLSLVATYLTAIATSDPLTHGARPGIEPMSQCSRDSTDLADFPDPVVPQ